MTPANQNNRHPEGMGCAAWALAFWVPGSLLMILGMQTALEMVKETFG